MDSGILALILALGGAALTPVAIAIGKFTSQAIQLQTLKLGNSNFEQIKLIVCAAVSNSQQMASSGQLSSNSGIDKKANAMAVAKKMLEKRKIKVDEDILSQLIEAQVWDAVTVTPVVPDMPTTTTVTTMPTDTAPTTTTTTTTPSTPDAPPQDGWTPVGLTPPVSEDGKQ